MKKIIPMEHSYFKGHFTANKLDLQNEYYSMFSDIIESASKYAIGPMFYMISSFSEFQTKMVSDNIDQLTPFSKQQWLTLGDTLMSAFHPDDIGYVISALAHSIEIYQNSDQELKNTLKFNIYARFQNSKKDYRWILMQNWYHTNELNEVEFGLHIYQDLSHFQISNRPLLSIIGLEKGNLNYFKHFDSNFNEIEGDLPMITKREKEVLNLMSQGYNTPEISKKLFISYDTVENHKRNLRRKTKTKTSSELIAYILKYNLLMLDI